MKNNKDDTSTDKCKHGIVYDDCDECMGREPGGKMPPFEALFPEGGKGAGQALLGLFGNIGNVAATYSLVAIMKQLVPTFRKCRDCGAWEYNIPTRGSQENTPAESRCVRHSTFCDRSPMYGCYESVPIQKPEPEQNIKARKEHNDE